MSIRGRDAERAVSPAPTSKASATFTGCTYGAHSGRAGQRTEYCWQARTAMVAEHARKFIHYTLQVPSVAAFQGGVTGERTSGPVSSCNGLPPKVPSCYPLQHCAEAAAFDGLPNWMTDMIWFLAEYLDSPNGASRATQEFLNGLLDWNRDVVVLSKGDGVGFRQSRNTGGPRVRWVVDPGTDPPPRPGRGFSPRKWLSWLRRMGSFTSRRFRATMFLRVFPPTVAIHNEFPYPGSFAHHVLHLAPRRLTVVRSTPECIAQFLRRRKTLTVESVAAGLSQMHGLVFVSSQLRDAWAALAPISDIPQWVISNSCREDEAASVLAVDRCHTRTSLGLSCEAFIAACVGYVHDGKGQDTIVAALPEMVRARPDLVVVFVGDDTSEWADRLKNTISGLGLAGHTRFVGSRPDPYAFIGTADLLIHPSRTEGQGRVLLEAMLLRTPVLASDVGGIPSVISHGETGWLVPPDDPAALLQGFMHLVANPDLRARMTDRAERSYWSHFSQQEYRTRFKDFLEEFAAARDTVNPNGLKKAGFTDAIRVGRAP